VVHWFRNYSAFSVVASSALLVSATNFSHGKDANALLFGYADGEAEAGVADGVPFRAAAQVGKKEALSFGPLAAVSLNADPDQKDDTTLFDIDGVSPQNQIVLSSQAGGHLAMAKDPEEDGGVKIYRYLRVTLERHRGQVRHHQIRLWANDLDNPDEIKPETRSSFAGGRSFIRCRGEIDQ
jgi:hypothetical protein